MFLKILYIIFILTCLFDPANTLTGLKLPVFVFIVFFTLFVNLRKVIFPKSVVRYIVIFAIIMPICSILWGWISNASGYRDESLFDIIKPYLFIFMAISLINSPQINICKLFSYCLLLLAITILIIFFLYVSGIVPIDLFYGFGDHYGLFTLGERDFGPITINRVYFHTSPMLIFGTFYFFDKYRTTRLIRYFLCVFLLSLALLLSGSRNNMIMAIAPFVIWVHQYGTLRVKFLSLFTLFIVFLYLLLETNIVTSLFDKTEKSNADKIGYLPIYMKIFSDPVTFVMGDGLGSYVYFPEEGYLNNTELTYFELLRRFGIFGALIYLVLMFKPVFLLYHQRQNRWMAFSLLMYLVMIFTNPFFFSSNGMLILSIVLATIYNSNKSNIVNRIK